MSVAASRGAYAAPLIIEDYPEEGQHLELRPPTWDKALSQFQNLLEERDRKRWLDSWEDRVKRGMMTREEYNDRVDKFEEEAANSNKYAFGGQKFMAVIDSLEKMGDADSVVGLDSAVIDFIRIVMGVDDILPLLAKRGTEVFAKFRILLKRAMPPKGDGAEEIPPQPS